MVLGTRFCRMVLGGATWVALGSCVSEAGATESFRLTWSREGPADVCPSSEKLAREVAAKLGYDPFDDKAETEIRGVIQRHGPEWTVRIAEVKNGEERYSHKSPSVVADDCGEPHALAVLVVSVFIQTGRLSLSSPPQPEAPESSKPVPEKLPVTTQVARVHSAANDPAKLESPRRIDMHVFLGGALGIGLFPTVAPAITLSAGGGFGRWELDVGMFWFPEVAHPTEPFRFGLTTTTVSGCFRAYPTKRITLLGCGSVWAGAQSVVITDDENAGGPFTLTTPGERAWFELAASPRLRFVLAKPFTLQVGADVLFPFRYDLVINEGQADEKLVFAPSPVTVVPNLQLGMTIF